jgi:hypothetical protein
VAVDVGVDVAIDGAVDVSPTLVVDLVDRAVGGGRRGVDEDDHGRLVEVNDNGGPHVHGAVDDQVNDQVNDTSDFGDGASCAPEVI